MYGLIGRLRTTEAGRSEVVAALLEGARDMPGNVAYLVAEDAEDPASVWVTEVWESEAEHRASLDLPSVRAAIARARPHLTGMGMRVVTRPVASLDA
ncbi:putative quinol monooxygenase [Demequina rhizosphaerae]|uniref:putative quinol monooxygenase n=1 Tax=Demequina rhizosphaerae TaxID=1638985 RepID=UPI0007808C95|nr:antibiotic biosynthesis monooxygenase [Demequina rhizosphaerae]